VRVARGLGAVLAPPEPTDVDVMAPSDPYAKLRPPLAAVAATEISSPPTAAELAAAVAALEALAQAVDELAGVA
jgi:hypothetical protein